jgi:transposase
MKLGSFCPQCFKKQLIIDRLIEENQRLKDKLRHQERKRKEGVFGSSTPSSKIPVKANTPPDKPRKPRGARPGHKGAGRKGFDPAEADEVIDVASVIDGRCPRCAGALHDKGHEERYVLDSRPVKARRIIYRLPTAYCPCCKKTFRPCAPGVLPLSLYGNQLIATATTMHYLHGVPLGKVCEQIGINPGSLVDIFHRLSRLFKGVPDRLVERYRQSPVRHADETGWRTDGKNGYVWLFATDKLSIFLFRKTREGQVARSVFGPKPLGGVLVVDRYAGYNKIKCAKQYCYCHLLREVQDLEKDFPDCAEVKTFVSTMAPLISLAIGLRNQPISDQQFLRRAYKVKSQIVAAVNAPAQHLAIRHIQDIFHDNSQHLYHWAEDRNIPAENNLAERDLRPTVVARKVSFGSSSDAGAQTRGVLMTVLWSMTKLGLDVTSHLKYVLDELSKDITRNPFPLLFPRAGPPP